MALDFSSRVISLVVIVACCCFTENGPQLSVVADRSKVVSRRGGNATLPCKIHRDQSLPPNPKMRIKWTKLTSDYLKEVIIYLITEDVNCFIIQCGNMATLSCLLFYSTEEEKKLLPLKIHNEKCFSEYSRSQICSYYELQACT